MRSTRCTAAFHRRPPLPQDQNPSWTGYSTAHREGDTLVIQTAGLRNDLWADMSGSPLSETSRLTERIRRPNYGTLELEVTVDDPKVYTKPWTAKLTQKLELDTELIDEICLENEKSYERMRAVRAEGGVSGRWSGGGDSVFVLHGYEKVNRNGCPDDFSDVRSDDLLRVR